MCFYLITNNFETSINANALTDITKTNERRRFTVHQ